MKGTRRKDRLITERVHDAYRSRRKILEPSVCPQCKAVYKRGRWQWAEVPEAASAAVCPACQRIKDRYPAGSISLRGSFLAEHRQEILNAVHNAEAEAKGGHPLQRIMDIEEQSDGVVITTTDMHLARSIGETLHRAYQGDLDVQYADGGDTIRVTWVR